MSGSPSPSTWPVTTSPRAGERGRTGMRDVARRRFLTAGAGLAAAIVLAPASRLAAQGGPVSAGPAHQKGAGDLAAANRPRGGRGVLEGYGQVGARQERGGSRYLMSRSI